MWSMDLEMISSTWHHYHFVITVILLNIVCLLKVTWKLLINGFFFLREILCRIFFYEDSKNSLIITVHRTSGTKV